LRKKTRREGAMRVLPCKRGALKQGGGYSGGGKTGETQEKRELGGGTSRGIRRGSRQIRQGRRGSFPQKNQRAFGRGGKVIKENCQGKTFRGWSEIGRKTTRDEVSRREEERGYKDKRQVIWSDLKKRKRTPEKNRRRGNGGARSSQRKKH